MMMSMTMVIMLVPMVVISKLPLDFVSKGLPCTDNALIQWTISRPREGVVIAKERVGALEEKSVIFDQSSQVGQRSGAAFIHGKTSNDQFIECTAKLMNCNPVKVNVGDIQVFSREIDQVNPHRIQSCGQG